MPIRNKARRVPDISLLMRAAVALIALVTLTYVVRRRRQPDLSQPMPPGPRGNPLLGSLPEIARDNVQFFMDIWRQHGDLVRVRGPLTLYLVVHPDGVKHVLQDNHSNYQRPGFVASTLGSVVGDGLVANEGTVWRYSRRMAQPAFHRRQIAYFGGMMTETTAAMLAQWQARPSPTAALDIKSEMMHLSLNILARATFQADWQQHAPMVEAAVTTILAHTHGRLTSPIDPQRFPLPATQRFNQALAALDALIYPLIAERRHTIEQHADERDLLSLLVAARDEETGARLTNKQVRDEIIGFLIAGHETVSAGLSWTWYLLAQNPDSWSRLQAEVETVLGQRLPTIEDVPRLRYTRMVIEESLRLYPPIFVLMRSPKQDDTICGYHVPAGSNVVLCPYVSHRHPDFWPNPEGFDPERFAPEASAGRHRMAYFPFASGPRKCIGDTFALQEMLLVVAMVTQRYRLDLVPGQQIVPEPAISLRPRHAMLMTLRPTVASIEHDSSALAIA